MDEARTRIQLCGRFVVEIGGRRAEQELPGRLGRTLFAYLVVHRDRPVPRDELADALWGEAPPAGAESSMAALLSRTRAAVKPAEIHGRSQLRLALPPDALVDVAQAVEGVHRAESAVALSRWTDVYGPAGLAMFVTRRTFMPDVDAPWADAVRRRLDDVRVRALEAYGQAALTVGGTELPGAERAGRELVERAPFRESGYRLLMRALAAGGNAAEALRVYDQLRRRLREELGVEPSPPTGALHETLLAQRGTG